MRGLKICLWITALACLLTLPALFLPIGVLESIVGVFDGQPFPDSPLLEYAIRTVSATFVAIGGFFIVLALNPAKYAILVPGSGLAFIFIGVVCMVTGPVVRMPALWFLGDALSCLVLGALILIFWRRGKRSTT